MIRTRGISRTTFFKWRSKYGGATVADVKRLRELETENAKLKWMFVANQDVRTDRRVNRRGRPDDRVHERGVRTRRRSEDLHAAGPRGRSLGDRWESVGFQVASDGGSVDTMADISADASIASGRLYHANHRSDTSADYWDTTGD